MGGGIARQSHASSDGMVLAELAVHLSFLSNAILLCVSFAVITALTVACLYVCQFKVSGSLSAINGVQIML